MDKRDYDMAAKLRHLAADLHEAMLDARRSGLHASWAYEISHDLGGVMRIYAPGDEKFEQKHLEIWRTTRL